MNIIYWFKDYKGFNMILIEKKRMHKMYLKSSYCCIYVSDKLIFDGASVFQNGEKKTSNLIQTCAVIFQFS